MTEKIASEWGLKMVKKFLKNVFKALFYPLTPCDIKKIFPFQI